MRVLSALLILAIAYSGFSAAAHAFESGHCGPAMAKGQQSFETSECLSMAHQQDETSQKDGQAAKKKCMDCTHCCTSNVPSQEEYVSSLAPLRSTHDMWIDRGQAQESLFSLLRPPRSLV